MSLPDLIKALAEKKIGEFCKKKVPLHALHQLNLSYKIRGNDITIFENRAPWRPEMTEWTSMPIAKIKYDGKNGFWKLYYADRNDRWHEYYELVPTKDIDKILSEIDKDPTRIFWG